MLPLSAAARQALLDGTAQATGRVDLLRGSVVLRSNVPLSGADPGSVDYDETAAVRVTCTLNFAPPEDDEPDPPLVPLISGPVAPYGNEAVVYVDLALPGGTVETLQLGVFGIRKPAVKDTGGPVVTAIGRDRSQRIIDAELTEPLTVPTGTNLATAIHDLIDAGVPGLTYLGFGTAGTPYTTVALQYAVGDNRWTRALEMADSAGRQLRIDNLGRVMLHPVPDPNSQPTAWVYDRGEDALATEIDQTLDGDATYSHSIVILQPADASAPPVRSDAFDDDPASPTYWRGPFGDRPVRLTTNYGDTQAQADAASAALLLRKQGLIEDLTLTAMAVYAHEDGDVVLVQDEPLGVDARYVLSRFSVPLGPGTSTINTRSRRVR